MKGENQTLVLFDNEDISTRISGLEHVLNISKFSAPLTTWAGRDLSGGLKGFSWGDRGFSWGDKEFWKEDSGFGWNDSGFSGGGSVVGPS